ncbi:hypothetical protein B9Z19DRAFT_1134018 [Tuber borchii]|uniref:Uncharacterized protein n=1 Tax=Tuber borchii TaxID=42251 RepID=A0A2T6ZES0_TUBBO|nr:hypothetical protein B9Z19DRAFT_1134018 [Tuber borchii]
MSVDADSNKQDMKPKGNESGPQEYAGGSDTTCSHEGPGQSRQPPSTKHDDDYGFPPWDALDINLGKFVELYSLTINRGEGDIIWQMEMWLKCHFKMIKCCKKVTIPNSMFMHRSKRALHLSKNMLVAITRNTRDYC